MKSNQNCNNCYHWSHCKATPFTTKYEDYCELWEAFTPPQRAIRHHFTQFSHAVTTACEHCYSEVDKRNIQVMLYKMSLALDYHLDAIKDAEAYAYEISAEHPRYKGKNKWRWD